MEIDADRYLNKFKMEPKLEYEFQQLCLDNEKYFGKAIWSLPYKPGVTDMKLREALKIAHDRGIYKIGYLIGIIKRLK